MDPQLHGPPWGDRNDYEGSVAEALEELVGVNDNAQEIGVWERDTNGAPFWSWLSMWAMRRYAVCKARELGYDYEGREIQAFAYGDQAISSGGDPVETMSTDERLVLYTYPNGDWLCFERCLPIFVEGLLSSPALNAHPWCWRQIEDKPAAGRFPEPEKPFDRDESMTLEERVAILCSEHKVSLAECGCKDMVQLGGEWVRQAYDAFDRPTEDAEVLACCDCGMPVDPEVDSIKTPAGTWLHLEGCVMPHFDDVKVKDKKRAPETKLADLPSQVEPSVIVSCADCETGCHRCDPHSAESGHAGDDSGSEDEPKALGTPCPACTGRLPCSVSGPCGGRRFIEPDEPVETMPWDVADDDVIAPEEGPTKVRTVHMVRMFDKASVCGRIGASVNEVKQKAEGVTCKSCLRMADSELELRKKVNGYSGEPRNVVLEDAPTPDTPADFGRIRMGCHCGRTAVASEEYWPRPVQGIYCDCGDLFVAWPIKLGDSAPTKTADGLEDRPAAGKWACELCSHLAHHHVGYGADSPLKCVSCDCPAFMQPGEKKSTVCVFCFHTYAWSLGDGVVNVCEQCARINCLVPYEGPAHVERLRTELKSQEKLDAKDGDLTEPELPPCGVEGCVEPAAIRFHRKGKGYPVLDACTAHSVDSKVRGRRRAFSEL